MHHTSPRLKCGIASRSRLAKSRCCALSGDSPWWKMDQEWPRYHRLVELVCSSSCDIVNALCSLADVTEVEPLAKSLLAVSLRYGDVLAMVRSCVRCEFASNAARPAQIFRTQNLASRVVGAHARMIGAHYLRRTLSAVVTALMAERSSLEVDPARAAACDEAALQQRQGALRLWGELFLARIMAPSSVREMPREIQDLLAEIRTAAEDLALDPKQVSALLGGYLFLRFFNPAIVAPEANGIAPSSPTDDSRRALVLVSKLLQVILGGIPSPPDTHTHTTSPTPPRPHTSPILSPPTP